MYVGCRWVQRNGGAWLIARYQEMGSRTDPTANPRSCPSREQIHPAASLDGNDLLLGGAPINIPAFSLCPTLKPCVGGWTADERALPASDPPLPPPPSSSPPPLLTACRESLEGWWWCPDYIRQMIPSFSHTRHSWLVAQPWLFGRWEKRSFNSFARLVGTTRLISFISFACITHVGAYLLLYKSLFNNIVILLSDSVSTS